MKSIKFILKQKAKEIWSASPDVTVYDALQLMADKDVGALPVLDGKKLVGIFSERDYARKVILKGKSSKKILVREIMSTNLVVITPDLTNEQGLALMTTKHVRHLPVVQEQKLVGFISIGDLVKSIIDEQKQVIDKLEQHIIETSGLN
jgi:CBS domain-containing protein